MHGDKENMKENSKRSFLIRIAVVATVVLIVASMLLWAKFNNRGEFFDGGEPYEGSVFTKYEDTIYAAVDGGGFYPLETADIDSFRPLESDYYRSNIGLDKEKVYFGNIPISDLNPDKLCSIGQGYYSDGENTYFCDYKAEANVSLNPVQETIQMLKFELLGGRKPQSHLYLYKKIETEKNLQIIRDLYQVATDGERVYIQGEQMDGADIKTLDYVEGSTLYFFDRHNIYYKSRLLPLKGKGKLKIVSIQQGDDFLYDKGAGNVAVGEYVFDMSKAPYKVIGSGGTHLCHLLFMGKDGLYIYNDKTKKQEWVGDNIFTGEVKEITPNVFQDDENIYYFKAREVRVSQAGVTEEGGGKVVSRSTEIHLLDKKEGWEPVENTNGMVYGQVWKKDGTYYYFDNLGNAQGVYDTVYRIDDEKIAELFLSASGDGEAINDIRSLVKKGSLVPINGQQQITVMVKYRNRIFTPAMILLIVLILIGGTWGGYRSAGRVSCHNNDTGK